MEATTGFHDRVPNPVRHEADGLFHDPVACHPTHGMCDADAAGGDPTRGLWLRGREFPATWCVLGWKDRDPMEEDALEALLLIETTAGGSGLARQLRHDLSRGWPVPGVTQEEEGTALLEHAEVLQGVPRLLATRRRFLLLGIFWALDGSFGSIWHNRGGTRGRLTGAW